MNGTSTHDLLLALAGRMDDDMLAWARELVAVGEDTRAVELVAAGLAADRVALPTTLRSALVDAAGALRTDLDAAAALAPATSDDDTSDYTEHRFTATHPRTGERVAAAVRALPARLLDGARVLLTWRLTPAGAAPGPLPHPVVLVEVEPGGRPCDVLAYQLSVALDRSGVVASVEVLATDRPLSAYHAAARDEARPVDADTTPQPLVEALVEPLVEEAGEAPTWSADGLFGAAPVVELPTRAEAEPAEEPTDPSPFADLPAVVDAPGGHARPDDEPDADAAATDPTGERTAAFLDAAERPGPRPVPLRPTTDGGRRRRAPDTDPEPRPTPRPQERRAPVVTPLSRSGLPSPVPLVRRDGSRPRPLMPVSEIPPLDRGTDEDEAGPVGSRFQDDEIGQIPAPTDTPMFRSMQDPLSGPLRAPLLAPLLDTTPHDAVPGDAVPDDDAADDVLHEADERWSHGPDGGEDDEDPFGFHGISPLAPDAPAGWRVTTEPPVRHTSVEDRWATEWASGDWALSATDLGDRPAAQDDPATDRPLVADAPAAGPQDDDHVDQGRSDRRVDVRDERTRENRAHDEPGLGDLGKGLHEDVAVSRDTADRTGDGWIGVDRTADKRAPEDRPRDDTPRTPHPLTEVPPPVVERLPEPRRITPPAPDPVPGPPPPNGSPETYGPPPEPPRRPLPSPAAAQVVPPAPESEPRGPRSDPLARLSDADRELLARLQSELGTTGRPRNSRRAGVAPTNGANGPNGSGTNGSGPNGGGTNGSGTNGSGGPNGTGPAPQHRSDPPDLAG
ncbi:hypothetical protein [Pseudonocardia sp.]|uniref:hypothetical protein n=1 Tax=Pseudonocardia sp. TaxID=60912 RepID=UPI002621CDD8|nr:hypothetical protein [Pseudonocardia sp.]MCW2722224.1 hypothetical protein [Pseudonocardia sp.]